MAFTHTTGRYASLLTVTNLPSEVIDFFWEIIDRNLKGVFELEPKLNFELLNHDHQLSIRFTQDDHDFSMVIDTDYPYNADWSRFYYAVDINGRETILTASEI